MTYILAWISLVLVSFGLILLGRWVKKEAQVYVLVGLIVVEISLIAILSILK